MRNLTKEEHIKLVEVGNEFWEKFSELIADAVVQFPEDLEWHVLAYLEDSGSVRGSNYDKYVEIKRRKL